VRITIPKVAAAAGEQLRTIPDQNLKSPLPPLAHMNDRYPVCLSEQI
jgi:hypothetical protein